jgi:type I restriction enzyme M protein
VYPSLRRTLFAAGNRPGYCELAVLLADLKQTIFTDLEFVGYAQEVEAVFTAWKERNAPGCRAIDGETRPKAFIYQLGEDLLHAFGNLRLLDKYDVYQHLMTYWAATMQDDVYLLVSDGWKAGNEVEWDKGKKEFEGKLVPKSLLVNRYFAAERKAIEALEADRDALALQREELEEEHGGDDGLLAEARNDKDKITTASVKERLRKIRNDREAEDEKRVLTAYLLLADREAEAGKKIKQAQTALNDKVLAKYKTLTEAEVKALVVDDKWMATLESDVKTEMQRISNRLTGRIRELAERYATPTPQLTNESAALEERVAGHLEKMGFAAVSALSATLTEL